MLLIIVDSPVAGISSHRHLGYYAQLEGGFAKLMKALGTGRRAISFLLGPALLYQLATE